MFVEVWDVVKLLMDSSKLIVVFAVRDSVLFLIDIRSVVMVFGNLCIVYELCVVRIMIVDDVFKGVLLIVVYFVLGDICSEVESYVGGKSFVAKDEMEVVMCLFFLVVIVCGVVFCWDVIDMIVLFVFCVVSVLSVCLNVEGLILKCELFDMVVFRAFRKVMGVVMFNCIFILVLIVCL